MDIRLDAAEHSARQIRAGAARAIVVPDHFFDNERQDLFCEVRIEISTPRQRAQSFDLRAFTVRIGRWEQETGFQFTDPLRALEALGEDVDQRRIEVVDAVPKRLEFLRSFHDLVSFASPRRLAFSKTPCRRGKRKQPATVSRGGLFQGDHRDEEYPSFAGLAATYSSKS
jgi:hypothetical protein